MSAVLLCSCGDKDEPAAESAPAETTVTIIPCSITSSGSSDYRPAPLEGEQKERVEKNNRALGACMERDRDSKS